MQDSFIRKVRNWKFSFYLLAKLPSAYFSGVRVKYIDAAEARVTVPYKWFSQNPFRSTYFACLAMAAEMSTGLLVMNHTYRRRPPVSMLVVKLEAEYFRKATGLTEFVCRDGGLIAESVDEAVHSGEAHVIRCMSEGISNTGELIARFYITWSVKTKSSTKKETP